jgi:hypothetical protein
VLKLVLPEKGLYSAAQRTVANHGQPGGREEIQDHKERFQQVQRVFFRNQSSHKQDEGI